MSDNENYFTDENDSDDESEILSEVSYNEKKKLQYKDYVNRILVMITLIFIVVCIFFIINGKRITNKE